MKIKNNDLKCLLYSLVENIPIPILYGKLRGKLWMLGSGGKLFRCITTTYELPLTHLFEKYVKERDVVYDIGSHAGYFTLLASYLVGEEGRVYSFEPNKRVFRMLTKNTKINKRVNTFVFNTAVSDKNCCCFFKTGKGSGTGKISDKGGEYIVAAVTLDYFVCQNNNSVPHVIKIDVEGEELNVLKGAKNLLVQHKPILFLSTHGRELYEGCSEFLDSIGYKIDTVQVMKDLIIAM